MARKNKMFAKDVETVAETVATVGIAEPETKPAPELDEAPKVDIISKADELAQYIEEVEDLRKYKEMYFKLQKEYDELLEKLSELTYKNAQLEEQKRIMEEHIPASSNKFASIPNTPIKQYHRKVNYINKVTNYKNNGYKDWN